MTKSKKIALAAMIMFSIALTIIILSNFYYISKITNDLIDEMTLKSPVQDFSSSIIALCWLASLLTLGWVMVAKFDNNKGWHFLGLGLSIISFNYTLNDIIKMTLPFAGGAFLTDYTPVQAMVVICTLVSGILFLIGFLQKNKELKDSEEEK